VSHPLRSEPLSITTDDVAVTVLGFAVAADIHLVGNLVARRNKDQFFASLGGIFFISGLAAGPVVGGAWAAAGPAGGTCRMGLVGDWRRRLEWAAGGLLLLSAFSTIGFHFRGDRNQSASTERRADDIDALAAALRPASTALIRRAERNMRGAVHRRRCSGGRSRRRAWNNSRILDTCAHIWTLTLQDLHGVAESAGIKASRRPEMPSTVDLDPKSRKRIHNVGANLGQWEAVPHMASPWAM
jgi:hypothetical protein